MSWSIMSNTGELQEDQLPHVSNDNRIPGETQGKPSTSVFSSMRHGTASSPNLCGGQSSLERVNGSRPISAGAPCEEVGNIKMANIILAGGLMMATMALSGWDGVLDHRSTPASVEERMTAGGLQQIRNPISPANVLDPNPYEALVHGVVSAVSWTQTLRI
ncbi:hypothetical protein BDW66DRAFT_155140 [Aspergillus desertorum]